MGVALEEEEAWQFLAASFTGVLSTLRRDGWPVSLPVWFAVLDRLVYLTTYPSMAKVKRIRRDPRAAFVVESGRSWTELTAVSLVATAVVLDDGEPAEHTEADRARGALAAKYPAAVNVPVDRLTPATRAYYAGASVIVRLTPAGPLISWDNARVRLAP